MRKNRVMAQDTDTLISSLVDELEPTRPLRFSRGAGLAFGGLAAALALVALLGTVRADIIAGAPSGIFMLASGLFLLLALACGAAVVAMGNPRVGTARGGWGWASAMAGLLPACAAVLIAVNGSEGWAAGDPAHGMDCLAASFGLGLVTAGVLVLWLRRGAPTSPEQAGLLTGIAAGSAGVFAFSFACPVDTIVHIGLWHGLAVIVSAAIGRLAVPALVRW